MRSFQSWIVETKQRNAVNVPIYMQPDHIRAVAQGIAAEDDMRRQISNKGLEVEPSDPYEDRIHGIDGYIRINGAREPVQIKRRTTTNEYAFEIAAGRVSNGPQPHPLSLLNSWNGKDTKSEANFYIVRNVQGTQATIIRKQDAWKLIQQAVRNWVEILNSPQLKQYPDLERKYMNDFYDGGNQKSYGIKLKIIWDREKSIWKLMAYITHSAIPVFRQVMLNPNDQSQNIMKKKFG